MAPIASVADSSGKQSPLTETRGCTAVAPFSRSTARMAACTSRGSSGCIRAIDSFTGRPSFIARLSSRPVTPASLYLVSASNQPSSGTLRPSASS